MVDNLVENIDSDRIALPMIECSKGGQKISSVVPKDGFAELMEDACQPLGILKLQCPEHGRYFFATVGRIAALTRKEPAG